MSLIDADASGRVYPCRPLPTSTGDAAALRRVLLNYRRAEGRADASWPTGHRALAKGAPEALSRSGRSQPTVRVIWVWAIGSCRGWRADGGTDYRAYRDTSGDATPTCSAIAAPRHIDIAVDGVAATAIDVGGVEVSTVACHGSGPAACAGTGPTSSTAVGGPASVSSAPGVPAPAASAAATTATAPAHEHQRCIGPFRRRSDDIARHGAAQGNRGGRRLRSD